MQSQQQIIDSLPLHLQPFAAFQEYSNYTPRDHAAWRFLLTQLRSNLSETAHPVYLEGLERTGISLDSIPKIEEMNDRLKEIGWRAVVVDGFVPPAIFMEFQAHKVLVIAVDMRTFDHMLYTPAPDIVHESAGHAPFIVDVDYAEFLQRFGELGMRAVASKGDLDVYEAIRKLSIVKESLSATEEEIAAAEKELVDANEENSIPSEAALLARLHWWTVEYGLVGELDDYRIFGAGLLSSLGESVNCLDDSKVTKLPLTVNAINQSYDITREQAQLFVTKSCRHLTQVLEEFGKRMCFSQGGAESVSKAIEAKTVNTAVLNSGVEVSGQFSEAITDAAGNLAYIKTIGSTQLSYKGRELPNQGIEHHPHGFGSPVGRLQTFERCLSSYTIDELKQRDIEVGKPVCLEFLSGVKVQGSLTHITRQDQKNLIFTFEQCTVTGWDGEILFDPDWGVYDMTIGDSVDSVYGGSADQTAFPIYQAPSRQVTISQDYNDQDLEMFSMYEDVRALRLSQSADAGAINDMAERVLAQESADWLLIFETLELFASEAGASSLRDKLVQALCQQLEGADDQKTRLINYGLERIGVKRKVA